MRSLFFLCQLLYKFVFSSAKRYNGQTMTEMAVQEHNLAPHSQPKTRMERRQQGRIERRQRLWRAIGWRASCAMLGATLVGTWSFVGARLEARQAKEPLPACTTLDESMSQPHLGQPTEIARRPSVTIAEALGDRTALGISKKCCRQCSLWSLRLMSMAVK